MRRLEFAGATGADCLVDGQYAVLFPGLHLHTSGGNVSLPGEGEDVLFPRVGLLNHQLRVTGQGHATGLAYIHDAPAGFDPASWTTQGLTHGIFPCIVDRDGRVHVATVGQGSQGYRYIDEVSGRLVIGDETVNASTLLAQSYGLTRIWEWTKQGDLFIGQGEVGAIVIGPHGRRILEPGDCWAVHFTREGDRCAVSMVKRVERKVVLLWFDASEVAALPPEPDPALDIPVIGRRCWLDWIEFAEPPSPPPGNGLMRVHEGGMFRALADGRPTGQWVQGDTVEEIEQHAAMTLYPAVAYWDAREWPRWPTLPTSAQLAIQGYCRITETAAECEEALAAVLASVPPHYARLALVCQCYTSNAGLTADLASLVPMYARLALRFPRVARLIAFSDRGRATGLNDHPEVRPLWQRLADGIPGPPVLDGDPMEDKSLFVANHPAKAWLGYPKGPGKEHARAYNSFRFVAAVARDLGAGWGVERKPGGDFHIEVDGVGYWGDGLRTWTKGNDIVVNREGEDAKPGWGTPQDAAPEGDRGFTLPPSDAAIVAEMRRRNLEPADDAPSPPSPLTVLILDYDKTVRRSDPNGMLVRFEAESLRPIVKIDLDLVGDDEVSIPIAFSSETGRDGRYIRALAFKPVRNGLWTLRVTATDDRDNTGRAEGLQKVTVVN